MIEDLVEFKLEMESSVESGQDMTATCLVCFEKPAKLNTVGPCKHSFCFECLDKHLSSQPQGVEVFPCPSCQQECPKPSGGVEGLDDWSREVETAESVVSTFSEKDEECAKNTAMSVARGKPCQLCEYKDKRSSDAEFRCGKCKNVQLCKACADEHHALPATRNHVVTSLSEITTSYAECCSHSMPLDLYCNSCESSGCSMCVLIGHGEHDVVEIENVIRRNLDKLKARMEKGAVKLREFEHLRQDTTAVMDVVLNWRGKMIQQVEEATEKVINQVLIQKEKLKKDIKTGCDVSELTNVLSNIPEVERSIQEVLHKGEDTLDETSLTPDFLTKLRKTVAGFDVAFTSDTVHRDFHFKRLWKPLPLYQENKSEKEIDLGAVALFDTDCISAITANNIRTMWYRNEQSLIPSVVAGCGFDKYAIVYVSDGPDSCRCDIRDHYYCANDEFWQRQTLEVRSVVDIAATPKGHLAVLHSDISKADSMVIKEFNISEKDLKGVVVCQNLFKAVSFAVNILGQYIVLSNTDNDYSKQITVLSKCGDLVDTFEPLEVDLRSIVCGGRYFYTLGKERVDVYEIVNGKAHFVNSVNSTQFGNIDDITATLADDVYATVSRQSTYFDVIKLCAHGEDCQSVPIMTFNRVTIKERHGESRIDIGDGWMVVSHGRKWSVFQLKTNKAVT